MSYDISIILPAYNVDPYIKNCLNSIFEQNFNGSFEVIVVDDCSTDNTITEIESSLDVKNNCTIVRHATNQGCSVARNSGLEAANGAYIAFVDPDDSLPKNSLQILFDTARNHKADIVKGNHFMYKREGITKAGQNTHKTRHYFKQDVYTALLTHKHVRGHPWGKLFKRSVIGNTRFKKGVRMAEDLLFCAEVFSKASSLTIIPNAVYNYHLRDDGATGKKFINNAYLDWIESVTACNDFIAHKHQRSAFYALAVRSLLQLAREARSQTTDKQREVLCCINNKVSNIQLNWKNLLFSAPTDIKTFARYIKFNKSKQTLLANINT